MNNCFLKKQEIKKTDRLIEPDLLKAAALFAVVFYHIGIQTYGCLGVDALIFDLGVIEKMKWRLSCL